ncbi:hypothetical protein SeseC_00807 [Streptococcus equi subsp. zooepidemicus ATCC 35246]|nr:hypothetical protein SeseC_00807 [Streptococcus equi subsp. zooepidemicus ATCC 35246]AIA68802.1 hypothetical protein Q426_05980 [Streptococcus equi subsp. zooepidemicus CY]
MLYQPLYLLAKELSNPSSHKKSWLLQPALVLVVMRLLIYFF